MNKYIKIISPFIFLLSLILILTLKSNPSGKLWKDYSLLYVPKESNDSFIKDSLEAAGIKDVVSLSGQFIPEVLSDSSIEIAMMRLNYNSPDFDYLRKRSAFFFDKSSAYILYYIPREYMQKLPSAVHMIENAGIPCGTDSNSSYPWLLPVIAVLLAGMLFIFVKNKFVFASASILPLIFLVANPFYPVALSSCLIFLCLFFISNLWKRRGAFSCILSKGLAPAMLGISILSVFSASVISGLVFLITILGTCAILYTFYFTEDFIRNRRIFVPVYIRSAKRISIFADKAFTTMTIITASAILFISIFLLTSSESVRSKISKIILPASTNYKNEELAQLEDYYRWDWNLKTYPYISLNNGQIIEKNGSETLEFQRFYENESTGIIETSTQSLSYNQAFKESVYEGIDSLKFNSIEKVMKSQGPDFNAGFSATNAYQINLFGIIMCFICLFVLLFIYFSIIIRKGINK